MTHWEKTGFVKGLARRSRRANDRLAILEGMANENNPAGPDALQVVHDDVDAAASAAVAEAEAANITSTTAVMHSAPEGYATGDGYTHSTR